MAWEAVRAHAETLAISRPLDRLAALRKAAHDHPFFFPIRRDLLLALVACGKAAEAVRGHECAIRSIQYVS